MQTRKPVNPIRVATIAAILIVVILVAMIAAPDREVYAQYESPDGQYTISVYRFHRFFAMPGQGSDAPGMVLLLNQNGKVLNRRKIDMVQLASEPQWNDGRVRMKLLFDWELR